MSKRWENVRVGEGVRYTTESGIELSATVVTVHEPETEEVLDENDEPTGETKPVEGSDPPGTVDLSVANPRDVLDKPAVMERVRHSLQPVPNTWRYA